jgi:hypothetical protein
MGSHFPFPFGLPNRRYTLTTDGNHGGARVWKNSFAAEAFLGFDAVAAAIAWLVLENVRDEIAMPCARVGVEGRDFDGRWNEEQSQTKS